MFNLKNFSILFSQKKIIFFSLFLTLTIATYFLSNILKKDHLVDVTSKLKDAKKMSSFKKRNKMVSRGPASVRDESGTETITIPQGEVAYLDESMDIGTLNIQGTLLCDEKRAEPNIILKAKNIIITGVFQCGSAVDPYEKKLIISLKDSDGDPRTNPNHRAIMVKMGGSLMLYGDRSKAGWTKLGKTASAGQNYIILDNNYSEDSDVNNTEPQDVQQSQFKAGDTIAIGPTGFDYTEAETFQIDSVDRDNPFKLYLNRNLSFDHYGEKQFFETRIKGQLLFDERAEVANLTRSIVIRADEEMGVIDESDAIDAQIGGHVMIHHHGYAAIDAVEFYKMGQAGIMARYPFHWHFIGDGYGQFVTNSSIHHSFQRCIVIHGTNNTKLENNVCFNFKGHGYFLEEGAETGNKIINNLAMMAKPPHHNKLLLTSDDTIHPVDPAGRFPAVSGFWITNPDNVVTNNRVSGSVGTGFWMSFESVVRDSSGTVIARPLNTNTTDFSFNTAHACKTGITWDGAAHGELSHHLPNNPDDKTLTPAHYAPQETPVFRGLVAYKNLLTGIYFRGQSAIFKDNVVADNGWSYWLAYNQLIEDSVLIGETANKNATIDNYFFSNTNLNRYRKTSIILYDGPAEYRNIDFLNHSIQPRSRQINGRLENTTVIPFTSTGGSNKFTNIVENLYFNPEPYYRVHMLGENESSFTRQMLGNAIIRDRDGSLIEGLNGGILIGKRSLGLIPGTLCSSGEEKYKNFLKCESSHTEGSIAFMRWNSSQVNAAFTPFIVRRSDNKYSYPKNEWGFLTGIPNNLFATVNSIDYSYEILPIFNYIDDIHAGVTPKLDANTESNDPISPIVRILAYGNNCKLGNDAVQVDTKSDLLSTRETSFYSKDDLFYVRLVPKETWKMITVGPLTTARDLRTNTRYPITCDSTEIEKRVIGKIENVFRNSSTTTVEGYACNYSVAQPIKVKVYAYGPPVNNEGFSSNPRTNTYTLLSLEDADIANDAETSFKCAAPFGGRKFRATFNTSELSQFDQHKFSVEGISNSGGDNIFLENSNQYDVFQYIQGGGQGQGPIVNE